MIYIYDTNGKLHATAEYHIVDLVVTDVPLDHGRDSAEGTTVHLLNGPAYCTWAKIADISYLIRHPNNRRDEALGKETSTVKPFKP